MKSKYSNFGNVCNVVNNLKSVSFKGVNFLVWDELSYFNPENIGIGRMSEFKTKNEEIEYLGNMIGATREEDTERLKTIGLRLIELSVNQPKNDDLLKTRVAEFDKVIVGICTELGMTYPGVDLDSGEIIEAIKALKIL